jgi:hypothetical protein
MQYLWNIDYLRNVYFLQSLLIILSFSACQSSEKENTSAQSLSKNSNEKEYTNVLATAIGFCNNLAEKNYEKSMLFADKSTQQFLLELKSTDPDFLNKIEFIEVDTCILTGQEALCQCVFNQNGGVVTMPLSVIHYSSGWLVNLHWNNEHLNPFLINIKADKRKNIPLSTPLLQDSIAERDLKNSLQHSLNCIHFPEVIINYMEKERLRTNVILPPRDSRLSLLDSLKYCDISYQSEYDVVVSYTSFNYQCHHEFTSGNILTSIQFTFTPNESSVLLAYFQYLATLLTRQLGQPYTVPDVPTDQFYHYLELKWFIKGFNEEIVLSTNNNKLELLVISVKNYSSNNM